MHREKSEPLNADKSRVHGYNKLSFNRASSEILNTPPLKSSYKCIGLTYFYINKKCLSLWIKQNMHLAALAIWASVGHSQSHSFPLPLPPPFWEADWIWKNHTICNAGFGAKVTLTVTSLLCIQRPSWKDAGLPCVIDFHIRAALRRTLRPTEYTAAQPWEIRPSVFLVRRTDPMECVAGRSVTETMHKQIKISP